MSTGTLRGQEGQPLVVGNMMYFESSYPNFVYAINLDNIGQIVWKFAPEQDKFAPSVACCDRGEPRRRLCRRKDSRHHPGHARLRARRQDRQGAVERSERRSASWARP